MEYKEEGQHFEECDDALDCLDYDYHVRFDVQLSGLVEECWEVFQPYIFSQISRIIIPKKSHTSVRSESL